MLPAETAPRTAVTKQGSCALAHIPLACAQKHQPAPPQRPQHFQASLTGTIPLRPTPPSQMQTGSPPLPPSAGRDLWLH